MSTSPQKYEGTEYPTQSSSLTVQTAAGINEMGDKRSLVISPFRPTQAQRQMSAWLDWLYYEDYLTYEQRPWAVIISVKTESMAPTIAVGEDVVGVLLDPSEYATATGIVAVQLKNSPDTYQIGRVAMGSRTSICLMQDNAAHGPVKLRRRDIRQIYQIVWIIAADVE